jgi:hypothetical protein
MFLGIYFRVGKFSMTQHAWFELFEHIGIRTQNPRLKRPSLYHLSYMLLLNTI